VITAEQRERLMKARFKYLIFCAILQMTVGVSMIWGIFQPHIMNEMGWDVDTVSATYPIMVITFVLGGILSGKLQTKFDARKVIIIGGIVLAAGAFAAAFTPKSLPAMLYITYGIISGTGFGIGYNQAIALSQQWFYDKRGFAGGVVVASLGIASMIATPLTNWLFENVGFRSTFITWAVIFLILSVGTSFFIKSPPEGFIQNTNTDSSDISVKQYRPGEIVKTYHFYLLVLCMICACISFYILSPIVVLVGQGKGVAMNVLVVGVMISSIANSVGRLAAAAMSDKIGRRFTVMILYVLICVGCLGIWLFPGLWIIPCYAIVCFCYGGFLATFPAMTTDFFGVKFSGSNYGLVMSGMGIASLLSLVVAAGFTSAGIPLDMRAMPAGVIAVMGVIFSILLRPIKDKNKA